MNELNTTRLIVSSLQGFAIIQEFHLNNL